MVRFRCALGLVALGLVGWLVFASDKPWEFATLDRAGWRAREYAGYFSFWAGLLNLVVLAGLILSAGWWAGRAPVATEPSLARVKWFWPLVIAAMIFCGASAAMRMNFGFAHDEDYSARRVISGSYKVKDNGEVGPEKLRWTDTFYYYRKPNNHPLHSVLARLSQEAWRAVAPPVNWHMREWVVRLPAWCGGVGAVAMLAVLIRRLGSARAAVVAAWLLALHPWHIRYASEARGYSLLLLIIPLCLYFWLRAMRENRWRWWLGFAAAEFALVYCYPGAIYVLLVLNGLTAWWLLGRAREWSKVGRWLAANCFAGMVALQLMLPLVPQLQAYMQTGEARLPLSLEWQVNTATHFLAGVSWTKTGLMDGPYPEVMPYATRHPVFFWCLLAGALGLLVVGYLSLFRRRWPEAPIAAATLLLPGFLGFLIAKLLHQWLFEWYLIYLLPGLVTGVAFGVDAVGRWLEKGRMRARWLPAGLAAGVVLAYGIFSQPFRHWYCTHPLEPVKEAAVAMRGTLDPNDPGHGGILTGVLLGPAWYYDPRGKYLKTPEDFLALLEKADEERKPLYIMVPHPWAAAFNAGPLWRLFNEAGLFSGYQIFHGFDESHNRVIARYVPGAVEGFDLRGFLRGREAPPNPHQQPLLYPGKPEIYPTNP